MKSKIEHFIEQKSSSVWLPAYGIALQIASWFVLFPIGVAVHKSSFGLAVFGFFSIIWFFIPLLGIWGVYLGFSYLKKYGYSFQPLLGIVLNMFWLLLFLGICYLFFYVGISV